MICVYINYIIVGTIEILDPYVSVYPRTRQSNKKGGSVPGGGGGGEVLGINHARMCVSESEGYGSLFGFK